MKMNAAKIQEAEAWVERNGLHPQPCGASVKSFCEAMGISLITYQRWKKNDAFVSALSRAREKFATTTIREVENALVKAAKGVEFTREVTEATAQQVTEYDPKTGKKVKTYTTDKAVPKKLRRETMYYPPSVEAAKFVLTNMDPEHWRLKQEITHTGENGTINVLLTSKRALDGLSKALQTGAKPRDLEEGEEGAAEQ